MHKRFSSYVLVCQVVLMLCLLPLIASAADVSGTMEINKKKFKLSHGYIDMVQPTEPLIVLSDKPLPPEQVPFLNADYAVKNKVHAVVFGIIVKDKKISKELLMLYTGGDYSSPAVGYPVDIIYLDVKQADESMIEGTIKTKTPNTLGELTYSFLGSFKFSSKAALNKAKADDAKAKAPKKVSFSGDDSAPVKAYKEYYRALMSGEPASMRKYLCAKSLKEFDAMADPREQAMGLELMRMRPEVVKISKPSLAGNEASFKVEGKEGKNISTGSIKMQQEGVVWKVLEDKWSTVIK